MASTERTARLKFGEMAVRKGYCTREQAEEAAAIQRRESSSGRLPDLIGHIMVRNGAITTGQHIAIVRAHQQAKSKA
jgi:hypothetical protein